jgi:hypothetical protein
MIRKRYETNRRWTAVTVTALLVAAVMCTACPSTTEGSGGSPPSSTLTVPTGWKTYTYGKSAISVPSDWAVTGGGCGVGTAPGTLLLGLPKVLPFCPMDQNGQNEVTLESPSSPVTSSEALTLVNGLRAYPIPVGNPGGHLGIGWSVPELGVNARGAGAIGSEVLHTLRRA